MVPEAQRKAHAELDAIIGVDRLPTIEDLPALPYVHAIVKEVNRWFTVLPMGGIPTLYTIGVYPADKISITQALDTRASKTTSTKGISSPKERLSCLTPGVSG